MATTRIWTSGGTAVAQVATATVGGTLAGETFTISANGVAIASFVDTSHAANDTATALRAAWNASTHPYRVGVTAGGSGAAVTLTADTAGTPLPTITVNTPGGSATFTLVATTANAGPNDWFTVTNWDSGLPVSTDSTVFPEMSNATATDLWGADASAVLLANFSVEIGCGIDFGSRLTPLHIDADYFTFEGTGEAFIQLDNSTEARIYEATGDVHIRGATNALLIVDAASGRVFVAVGATETATFTTVQIDSGTVQIGTSLTCTTMNHNGGTTENASDVGTLNVRGGTITQTANTPTTLNVRGGKYVSRSTDTITTLTLLGGVLDLQVTTTATTVNIYGGTILHPERLAATTVNLYNSISATFA